MPKANALTPVVTVGQAAEALLRGEIVAYPTEAIWGLGCDPFSEKAVKTLLELKGRTTDKGLIIVAASLSQVRPYIDSSIPEERLALLEAAADTPVTWLVPVQRERVPVWLTGNFPTLAIRISSHPVVRDLCRAFGGPLVSTSANPAGREPARTAEEVVRYFGERIPLCQGETGTATRPSTIRDLLTGDVIRE